MLILDSDDIIQNSFTATFWSVFNAYQQLMLLALTKISYGNRLISFFLGYEWILLKASPSINAIHAYVEDQHLESHPHEKHFAVYGYDFVYFLSH